MKKIIVVPLALLILLLTVQPAGAMVGPGAPAPVWSEATVPAPQAILKAGPPLHRLPVVKPAASETGSRLAAYTWGSYHGEQDMSWAPYERATGVNRELLGRIALPPKAKWFGDWISDGDIGARTRDYIVNAQAGNPDALVQMSIFRMDPWESEATHRVPTRNEIRSYKRWIRNSAAAIGNTPTALILQPDEPFLMWVPNFKLSAHLIRFAAKIYGALPRTYVYLEAGAADWPAEGQGGVAESVRMLSASGIEYADGIATNSTHYSATSLEIERVAAVIQSLHAMGYNQTLKAVINTSSNGHPFVFGDFRGKDPDEAPACRRLNTSRTCIALGIPPTAAVTNSAWGLSAEDSALAAQYVDAFLWIGRPWLLRQAQPFLTSKALTLVKRWPFA